jgi:hypothetical protein
MDGSDDYFTDDIFLDDQALAVLDQEEQKYLTQVTQNTAPPPAAVRSASKRKRSSDETFKRGVRTRPEVEDEIEDLPEISLQDDGSYRINQASRTNSKPVSKVVSKVNSNNGASTKKNFVQQTNPTVGRHSVGVEQRGAPQTTSRSSSADSRHHPEHVAHNRGPPSLQANPPKPQTSLGNRSKLSVDAYPAGIPIPLTSARIPPPPLRPIQSPTSLGKRSRSPTDARPRDSVPPPQPRVSPAKDTPHPLAKQVEELQKKLQEVRLGHDFYCLTLMYMYRWAKRTRRFKQHCKQRRMRNLQRPVRSLC